MSRAESYPDAVDPEQVGEYAASSFAGGGFVWDEVLEYRVWFHPENGAEDRYDGDDYYLPFSTYEDARTCSETIAGAEAPLALVLQKEYIDEPAAGTYVHIKEPRVTEWPVEFLQRPRRTADTIPQFFAPDAPSNRLDILRGKAPSPAKR